MASKAESPQNKQEPDNNQEYIFKRDYKSSMRLNYNHFLIKEVAGYLIHPSIPTHQPNLRIADVGTETGVQVDGFDISAAQFPAAGFRPHNVHLYTHNGFQDYASEFQKRYDIVHARFWIRVVSDPDAKPLLRKLLSLLMDGTVAAGCASGGDAGRIGNDDCVGETL
ncbi:hypothetical protein BTUL_0006g00410 [Botrytis tulipae]|uniref:Methyltransferase type 11 domain-containing protein n=1 Tax=Botrytis tulipae TaxID=87230 RepID=A0A4Z1F6C3_9HELO|nr:hypothetical protein BTUL_0006g00410 [Botrytis tulipae]